MQGRARRALMPCRTHVPGDSPGAQPVSSRPDAPGHPSAGPWTVTAPSWSPADVRVTRIPVTVGARSPTQVRYAGHVDDPRLGNARVAERLAIVS